MKMLLSFMFIVSAFVVACVPFSEVPTKVKVSGDTKPDFVLSGSGDLSRFTVFDTSLQNDPQFPDTCIWKIEPVKGTAIAISEIGRIKYGVLPDHYKQIVPSEGTPPPTLKEGKRYVYIPETENAPYTSGEFLIMNGKAVDVSAKK